MPSILSKAVGTTQGKVATGVVIALILYLLRQRKEPASPRRQKQVLNLSRLGPRQRG